MLGLPDQITALLFDLDGVLTDTASLHFAAWSETFDEVLKAHHQAPFTEDDYDEYVDGKPRVDGVRSLLKSRDISLPDGDADDSGESSVNGIANVKNKRVLDLIKKRGVEVYPGSRRYLERATDAGLRRAVVSSSANAAAVLEVTGLATYIEQLVDGNTLTEQHLAGKPAPDSFLAGARLLDVTLEQAVVFEDAVAGVAAGRAGRFGYVVGVNRQDKHHGEELRAHADVVVADLGDLL